MKKTKIIGVVIVVVVVGLIWFFTKGPADQQVSRLDIKDTVANFYGDWLKAVREPVSANPTQSQLANSPVLSKTLRDHIKKTIKQPGTNLDPVLCQTVIPERISTRMVFENADKAQILITSPDKKVTEQALTTLIKYKDGWYIDSIQCSPGEFGPQREFSFESQGFLLKSSIPAPYNSKDWHLVYEENGQAGNVIPIFFDSKSQCVNLDGTKSTCKPDQFTEATKVFVHGQMTERGISVTRQEFVK
ncbi:MAG: hypothetical protein WC657_01525 [Candidatus Paceibacterota bacterium]|jgi:hypothetical protein